MTIHDTDLPLDDDFDDDVANLSDANPFHLFDEWLAEAHEKEINDANAMALATVDEASLPNARMVLLKGCDERGFTFYTNTESRKGAELLANMQAAAVFHWKTLRRQVRVRGRVEVVSDEEADEYYASRPRGSRIGAWASQQSRPLANRLELRKAVAAFTAKYAIGNIPRPRHWTGFRIVPASIEFWANKPFRLHDRTVFSRADDAAPWRTSKLYP